MQRTRSYEQMRDSKEQPRYACTFLQIFSFESDSEDLKNDLGRREKAKTKVKMGKRQKLVHCEGREPNKPYIRSVLIKLLKTLNLKQNILCNLLTLANNLLFFLHYIQFLMKG